MRKPLIVGNWKMNKTASEAASFIRGLRERLPPASPNADVVLTPPFTSLESARNALGPSSWMSLGAQNVHWETHGAFTGEVSAPMLRDLGCRYVIVGHSERRALFGERDETIQKKVRAALAHGLSPILCVGESLAERESGVTEAVVGRQLDAVIKTAGVASLAKAVVAYEPVWAIGTGKTASPEQAQAVHAFIRGKIAVLDAGVADQLVIQYGGSVKASNAAELMAQPDIDGGLIGGASLLADEFVAICRAAAK